MTEHAFLRFGARALRVAVLVCSSAREAAACSCGFEPNPWENRVVFHGQALEQAVREELTPECDAHNGWSSAVDDTYFAVRYRVEASNVLKPGDEVLVYHSPGPCGGGNLEVGTSGLVLASDVGGVLLTSLCPFLKKETRAKVYNRLGIDPGRDRAKESQDCATVEEFPQAFDVADTVVSAAFVRECLNHKEQRLERLGWSQMAWKGMEPREWFITTNPVGADVAQHQFLNDRDAVLLTEPEQGGIQLGDCFTRPDPNTAEHWLFVKNGGEERLALPGHRPQWKYEEQLRPPDSPAPSLSCATISQDMFNAACRRVAAARYGAKPVPQDDEPAEPAEQPGTDDRIPPAAPERGGCASCSAVGTRHPSTPGLLFGLGLLGWLMTRKRAR